MSLMLLLDIIGLPASGLCEPIKIRIGATLPLTGSLAIAGNDTQRGIELALEEFRSPELALEVVFDDNQHNAKQAVSSAQKLLDVDQVNFIISMWDMADVIAPLAERKQVPHMAIRWNPHIAEQYRYTFTVESTYKSYVDSLLHLLQKESVQSVVLLTEDA